MESYSKMSSSQLKEEYNVLSEQYAQLIEKGYSLDMSRGKPSQEQLELSMELLSFPKLGQYLDSGIETRNYGGFDGIVSCKKLFAELLNVEEEKIFIGGNASLTLMYDIISKAYTHGLLHSASPWCKLEKVKFLCPVPGYDRHFTICETFGIEMINITMTDQGPDMDMVEALVSEDNTIKGMWCVPKYSNPDGITYSKETLERLAALKPSSKDFVIMWDNAYCVHHFGEEFEQLTDILSLSAKYDNEDLFIEFASTSKVTMPGSGISCFTSSKANMAYLKKLIAAQTISNDKINQLRHVQFLKNLDNVLEHMKKHALILAPKFDCVLDAFDNQIKDLQIASWHRPKGGYFISLNVMPNTGKKVHLLMKAAGIIMTEAGATFPYGNDPEDSNLRIAPSFPPLEELIPAIDALCICIKIAAVEELLNK